MGKLIFAIVAAIVLLLLIALNPARAAVTLKGKESNCTNLAIAVMQAAQWRDGGVTWADFEEFLKGQVEAATGAEGSYIQNADDAAWVMGAFKQAFELGEAPNDAAMRALTDCMKIDAKGQPWI